MSQSLVLVILAAIILILALFAPKIISFRISLLHWLKLNKMADWHQRNRTVFTASVRVILVVLAGYLLYIGVPGL